MRKPDDEVRIGMNGKTVENPIQLRWIQFRRSTRATHEMRQLSEFVFCVRHRQHEAFVVEPAIPPACSTAK